jgi:pimeloyl-ACP methyl ester carboxylesterase
MWGYHVRVSVQRGTSNAPPVLMCMGLGGWLELWDPLRSRLAADGLTTVAFDAPGVGDSPAPPVPWPLVAHGHLALRLLRHLGMGRVSVLGLSWGGLLAQHLAITAPHRVRRVVLASTNYGLGSLPGSPRGAMAMLDERASRLGYRERVSGGDRPWGSRRGRLFQIVSLAGWSSLPLLPLMRQPGLVIAGDRDEITPLFNAKVIAFAAPRCQLHVVPGGGHGMMLEPSTELARTVSTFLRAA